ncbi:MAG: carbonic anhydrase [Blastocatellia bacterium]
MPPVTFKVRAFTTLVLLSLLSLSLLAVPALTADELPAHLALSRLLSGNERFVSGKLRKKDYQRERPTLAQGQQPYAIILACADSRVAPEVVFDESLGRLFTVRVAGNVADPAVLGSIEYAVEHLHVKLLMVMGHDSCGAVKATMGGGELPPNIKSLVTRIKPAVDKVWTQGIEEKSRLDAAIKENVHYQIQSSLYESEIISEAVHKKELLVVGSVYHLNTGKVEILSTDVAVQRHFADDEGYQEAGQSGHGEVQTSEKAAIKQHAAEEHDEEEAASEEPKAAPRPRKSTPAAHKPERVTTHKAPAHSEAPAKAADEHKKPEKVKSDKKADHAEEPAHKEEKTRKASFEKTLRSAYDNDQRVMLKKSMLMRDGHDGCATDDCRSIPAGELVRLENPLVLNVMGRPQLKVRYKGKSVYIPADETALAIVSQ